MNIEAKIIEIMTTLRNDLISEFEERGWDEPCFIEFMPGDAVALNYALGCDPGQAWIRLVGVAPPEDVVVPASAECYHYLAMTFEMGIIRSAPVGDEEGNPMTAAESYATTLRQLAEMGAMLSVMQGADLPDDEEIKGLNYQPFGPDGGAVGGTWTGTVRLI